MVEIWSGGDGIGARIVVEDKQAIEGGHRVAIGAATKLTHKALRSPLQPDSPVPQLESHPVLPDARSKRRKRALP